MAGRTITQRIQLVGGDEIKVQLDALGKAGELAFTRVSAAAKRGGIFSKFGSSLDSVRTKMIQVGEAARNVGEKFTAVGESIGRAGERLGIVAGVGLVEAGRKLVEVAKGAGESQEALDNNAAAVG